MKCNLPFKCYEERHSITDNFWENFLYVNEELTLNKCILNIRIKPLTISFKDSISFQWQRVQFTFKRRFYKKNHLQYFQTHY